MMLPDDETDFLNFDYNNTSALAQRNLELANVGSSQTPFHLEQ